MTLLYLVKLPGIVVSVRSSDRTLVRVAAARDRLASHHSAPMPNGWRKEYLPDGYVRWVKGPKKPPPPSELASLRKQVNELASLIKKGNSNGGIGGTPSRARSYCVWGTGRFV